MSSCKKFGECSLNLTKLLQDIAKDSSDRKHKQKIINAILDIKDLTPQIMRAAKVAFDDHKNKEKQQELQLITGQLATKISYAIQVAQPDGGQVQSEISASAPTVPLPVVSFQIAEKEGEKQQGRPPRRRRTITDSVLGAEVLKRVRTATLTRIIEQTIEGTVDGGKDDDDEEDKKEKVVIEPEPITPQQKKEEDEMSEELFSSIESDLDSIENDLDFLNFSEPEPQAKKPPPTLSQLPSSMLASTDSFWKSKYDELKRENVSLKLQNDNLLRVIEDLTGRKKL